VQKVTGAFGAPVSTFLRGISQMEWTRSRERLDFA
jgi:hypothetical protein